MEKKKIYNEPVLKVVELRAESLLLEISIEVVEGDDVGGAGAKHLNMFDDDDDEFDF